MGYLPRDQRGIDRRARGGVVFANRAGGIMPNYILRLSEKFTDSNFARLLPSRDSERDTIGI
jgi:hypothetical protein